MGLDMYLSGEIYFFRLTEEQRKTQPVEHIYRLGYWRKHPDLHGYIVEKFANGEDDCRKIELSACNVRQIIEAIRRSKLPHTEGFFFGESANDEAQKAEDIGILENALLWLDAEDDGTYRSIAYQASW